MGTGNFQIGDEVITDFTPTKYSRYPNNEEGEIIELRPWSSTVKVRWKRKKPSYRQECVVLVKDLKLKDNTE